MELQFDKSLFSVCTFQIPASGNRENIFLSVNKMPSTTGSENAAEQSYIAVLEPLLQELIHDRERFLKTIVYTKLKWCGFAYDYFHRSLLSCPGIDIRLVSQYHAPCKDDVC